MPSGRVHSATSAALAVISLPACVSYAVTHNTPEAILFPLGCLAGMILTPDLDINHPMIAEQNIRRYTGGAGAFLAGFWYVYWWPYSIAIGHRSWVSHFPIISTIIRVGYLLFLPMLVYFLLTHDLTRLVLDLNHPDFLWVLGGLMVSDLFHWVFDITQTAFKRARRKLL